MLDTPDAERLKGIRDKAILATLFYTGCRVSEVCTLKVKDFYQEQSYYVLDFWIKGGKRNRLAVNQELHLLINDYLRDAGHEMENDNYLFLPIRNAPNASDTSLTPYIMWRLFARNQVIKNALKEHKNEQRKIEKLQQGIQSPDY